MTTSKRFVNKKSIFGRLSGNGDSIGGETRSFIGSGPLQNEDIFLAIDTEPSERSNAMSPDSNNSTITSVRS